MWEPPGGRIYSGAPWGAQKASVPEKLLRGALSGPGAPRPVRAGATPPSPYALRTSPRAAATTGGRLPRLPAQLRPRSVRSSQDAETLRSSPQATVAIGAASVGAQTESQRVPGLIRRRPAGQPVIMRTCICLCGCASGMRLLWAECRLGRAPGQGVVCRGLRGQPLAANSLGGGVERRCGTCPARAKLNCGLEHAQAGCADALRCRSGLLGLLTRRRFSLIAPLALTVAAGVQAVCGSAAPRSVTGIDRVDSVAPLLSVLSGLPGLVVVLRRGRRVGGCWWCARTRHIVCVRVGMHPMLDVP